VIVAALLWLISVSVPCEQRTALSGLPRRSYGIPTGAGCSQPSHVGRVVQPRLQSENADDGERRGSEEVSVCVRKRAEGARWVKIWGLRSDRPQLQEPGLVKSLRALEF
jgi:hypothetical protein